MLNKKYNIFKIDRDLFIVLTVLIAFGTVLMYSASTLMSKKTIQPTTFFLYRHLIWIFIGLFLAYISYSIPTSIIKKYSKIILLFGILIIIAGILLNPTKDSSRWLIYRDGAKQLTTSDFGRLALIIFISWFLDKYSKKINDFKNVLLPFLFSVGILFFSVLSQPDFSTTIVFGIILLAMLFIGGLNIKYIGGIILSTFPFAIYKIYNTPYILTRLTGFMNENSDSNEQVDKAIMAMGSAGIFGKGLGDGLLKKGFIPEIQTDFIFSVIGEELGFISEMIVLIAFIFLFFRGVQLAQKATSPFSMFLVLGISINFIIYVIINVGYVVKLLPTTGLALPFISYGGSHTMVSFIMVGLLFNVSNEIKKNGF
jgi:cell division protein FtsW